MSIVNMKAVGPTSLSFCVKLSTVGRQCSLVEPSAVFFIMKAFTEVSAGNDMSVMTRLLVGSAFSRVINGETWNHGVNGGRSYGPNKAPHSASLEIYCSMAAGC